MFSRRSDARLVNVIYIRATPRALWNALTRPQLTRQYYVGLELKAELKPGGRFDYMHRAELHGRPGKPSRVTYEIEPMGLVCKLTVTHDEFPRGGPTLESVKEGWPEILSSLKSLLETGQPLAIPRNP